MKMSKKKKSLAVLLAAMLLLAVLPTAAFAADIQMEAGASALTVYSTTQTVMFAGQEWYVIGYNDGTTAPSGVYTTNSNSATLLLKSTGTPYGATAFRTGQSTSFANSTQYPVNIGDYYANNPNGANWATPNEYQGSTLQQAMEALAADTSKFPANEAAYINARTLTSTDGIVGGNVANQLLWPLSLDESIAIDTTMLSVGANWWLRSPGVSAVGAAYVYNDGLVDPNGDSAPRRLVFAPLSIWIWTLSSSHLPRVMRAANLPPPSVAALSARKRRRKI